MSDQNIELAVKRAATRASVLAIGVVLIGGAAGYFSGKGVKEGYVPLNRGIGVGVGDPGDPPIVVHGGSMLIYNWDSNNFATNTTLNVTGLTANPTLSGRGYGSKLPTSLGYGDWTINVCTDQPDATPKHICSQGLSITSVSGTVKESPLSGSSASGKGMFLPEEQVYHTSSSQDWKENIYEFLDGNDGVNYYPRYLVITINGTATVYQCYLKDPNQRSSDYCYFQIGSGH